MRGSGGLHFDRRDLLRISAALGAWAAAESVPATAAARVEKNWAQDTMRWFQLAFTEDDPGRFDPAFWLDYFREIHADGACLSAGGGIAFYPTQVPHHGRACDLGDTDPFGDMVKGCKRQGMAVIARIDPSAMNAQAFAAHPEWAAYNADGTARRHPTAKDLYLTCQFGPYHGELIPRVLTEVATRYPVDGFFGNRWNGSGVCYCTRCQAQYRAATGKGLPAMVDTTTPEGQRYAAWTEQRMLALIDLWNRTARAVRPELAVIPGGDRRSFVPFNGQAFGSRVPILFGDRQGRSAAENGYSPGPRAWGAGRYVKELRGIMEGKPIGHIISVGVEEEYRWKDSVQSEAEIRIWAAGAIAHGARPWITKFNAKPLDKRWLPVVSSIYNWHHANERYLRNTRNMARVAIVHSARDPSLMGKGEQRFEVERYRRGYYQALLEARIPFDVIDDSFLDPRHLDRYRTVVLPNCAILSDAQCETIRGFVQRGGRLVATHATSLYDETAKRRVDFGLADLFGCHFEGRIDERMNNAYLTLRHPSPALAGLEAIGRTIGPVKRIHVRADGASHVPLTLIPSYSDLPMERVFTTQATSDTPMAFCRTVGRGRVVYLPMDLDRTFDEIGHGDHLKLLGAMVDWATQERRPLEITGPGLIDIALWRQERSLTAHLVNLNNPMTMQGSYREAIETGPYTASIALPQGASVKGVRLLEAGRELVGNVAEGRLRVQVPSIAIHEVIAIDLG